MTTGWPYPNLLKDAIVMICLWVSKGFTSLKDRHTNTPGWKLMHSEETHIKILENMQSTYR